MYPNGLTLGFRKPESEDASLITTWYKDPVFIDFLYGSPLDSDLCRQNRFQNLLNQNAKDRPSDICLLATHLFTKEAIALLIFKDLNWKNRNAELNIAIGNPAYRHSFYGAEIYLLALCYAFFELNLHKVIGYAYENNSAAMKLSHFAGELNGVLNQHVYRRGVFKDVYVYSLLKEKFEIFLKVHQDQLLKKYFERGLLSEFV